MNRSRSALKTVAEVSGKKERETAQELAAGCKKLNQQLEQLEQLQAFREDYAGQAYQRAESGADLHNWQLYADFLDGIDDVIARQERFLRQTHSAIKNKRANWQQANRRTRTINEVLDRVERHLRRRSERRQQTEVDDQSSARAGRAKSR